MPNILSRLVDPFLRPVVSGSMVRCIMEPSTLSLLRLTPRPDSTLLRETLPEMLLAVKKVSTGESLS